MMNKHAADLRRIVLNDDPNYETQHIDLEQVERERAAQRAKQQARRGSTGHLSDGEDPGLHMFSHDAYSLSPQHDPSFITLPALSDDTDPRWLIELQFEAGGAVQNIEIAGDVVLGVQRPGCEAPDFDLSTYGGLDKGVSRHHALLRPGKHCLYVIDLRSTNGTHVNGLTVKNGFAVELHSGDILTLGALSVTVRVTARVSGRYS